MQIQDAVVLITGASDGIGAACAKAFRARGARLFLTGRSEEKLLRVAEPHEAFLPGDLTQPAFRQQLMDNCIHRFGRIDILVNNAGVGLYEPAYRASTDWARYLFELNFFAPLDLIQRATSVMRQRGQGMIVNVSSLAGKVTLPWFTLYSASKFALNSLSEGLQIELKGQGIHVMLVCPGYVDTGFQSHVLGGAVPERVRNIRRWAISPERCAEDIVRGVERDAYTVVTPATGWLFVAFARLAPGILRSVLERIYRQRQPLLGGS